jgi:hypothetical protein
MILKTPYAPRYQPAKVIDYYIEHLKKHHPQRNCLSNCYLCPYKIATQLAAQDKG